MVYKRTCSSGLGRPIHAVKTPARSAARAPSHFGASDALARPRKRAQAVQLSAKRGRMRKRTRAADPTTCLLKAAAPRLLRQASETSSLFHVLRARCELASRNRGVSAASAKSLGKADGRFGVGLHLSTDSGGERVRGGCVRIARRCGADIREREREDEHDLGISKRRLTGWSREHAVAAAAAAAAAAAFRRDIWSNPTDVKHSVSMFEEVGQGYHATCIYYFAVLEVSESSRWSSAILLILSDPSKRLHCTRWDSARKCHHIWRNKKEIERHSIFFVKFVECFAHYECLPSQKKPQIFHRKSRRPLCCLSFGQRDGKSGAC